MVVAVNITAISHRIAITAAPLSAFVWRVRSSALVGRKFCHNPSRNACQTRFAIPIVGDGQTQCCQRRRCRVKDADGSLKSQFTAPACQSASSEPGDGRFVRRIATVIFVNAAFRISKLLSEKKRGKG
jgi:hypothetical protein